MPELRLSAEVRHYVFDRAYGCCEYCRSQAAYATQTFAVEHIVPRVRGGTSEPSNLALACQGCNNHKYDKISARDPLSGDVAPLYHPRRDNWNKHFTWSDDYSLLVGLTPTGRATVATLQLNREGIINLRGLLLLIGLHPPPIPQTDE